MGFKKQDHIYLCIEDFFFPGHKYENQEKVCLWTKPRGGGSVEDNRNMPAMMSFFKFLKSNRKAYFKSISKIIETLFIIFSKIDRSRSILIFLIKNISTDE